MFRYAVAVMFVICTTLSAQADSCDIVQLLNDLVETKVNRTLNSDLDLFVEAEVNRIVDGAIDNRIETKVNQTLNVELESRVKDHVKTALADEPGKQYYFVPAVASWIDIVSHYVAVSIEGFFIV